MCINHDSICIMIEDIKIFKAVMAGMESSTIASCSNCGSICLDARNATQELHRLVEESYKNEFLEDIADVANDILAELIEPEPEFNSMTADEWEKWDGANEERKCSNIGEYECAMYLKYSQVCISHNESCKCFKKYRSNTIHIIEGLYVSKKPLTELLYKKCEECGAINNVDAQFYEAFLGLDDENMIVILKCIIISNAREINKIVFHENNDEAKSEEKIRRSIKNILSLISRGMLVLNENGQLYFMKPVGPLADEEVLRLIQDKIDYSVDELLVRALESLPPSVFENYRCASKKNSS